jgi:exopolysaccharide production protein ExoY
MDIGLHSVGRAGLERRATRRQRFEPFRLVELVLSTGAILFLLPLLLVIAVLIRIDSPGPVLFMQSRVGRGGRMFSCFKFRSMAVDANERLARLLASDEAARGEWETTQKLGNDPRITRVGRFLRKSSLDELPQLFNVLRGEMSLVGPRPIVPAEICRYGRHMLAYQRVRPGISGLWQISGRSDTSYRRRVACDVLYVRRRCFLLNMKITLATIPVVLMSRGAR